MEKISKRFEFIFILHCRKQAIDLFSAQFFSNFWRFILFFRYIVFFYNACSFKQFKKFIL